MNACVKKGERRKKEACVVHGALALVQNTIEITDLLIIEECCRYAATEWYREATLTTSPSRALFGRLTRLQTLN